MKHREKIKLLLVVHLFLLIFLQPIRSQTQTVFKVPAYPHETCIVDYDMDGDNDIIVGCSGSNQDSIVIFYNDGWGNFEEQKFESNNRTYIYCRDLTNDDYPDIITRYPGNPDGVYFYENDTEGGLGDSFFITDMVGNTFIGGIADINLDGNMDIVNYDLTIPWGWGVAFNNGNYSFTDSAFVESNETTLFPTVGHLNDDNKPDILITTLNLSDSVSILFNNYPKFSEQNLTIGKWAFGFVVNINNDTNNDILLYKPSFIGSSKLVNYISSNGDFQACESIEYVNGTELQNTCDYDLDGYDDITVNIYRASNQPVEDSIYIYFNDQNCGFTHVQSVYMGEYAWLPTVNHGDLNNDGYPELVIQGYHFPRDYIRILWNDGTGHFIDTNSVYVHQYEIDINKQIIIYPNPTSGHISICSANEKIQAIKIMDMNGRILLNKELLPEQTSFHLNLHGIQIKQGVFLCLIQMENETFIYKKLVFTKPG